MWQGVWRKESENKKVANEEWHSHALAQKVPNSTDDKPDKVTD